MWYILWDRDKLKSSSSSISGSTVGSTDDKNNATDDDDNNDERKVTSMEFDTRNNIDDAIIWAMCRILSHLRHCENC